MRSNQITFREFRSALILCGACVSLLVNPPAVVAQTGDSQSVALIEEIVVTARKRDETLQESPIVATVFGEEAIDRYDINSMEDLSKFTPGLMIGTTYVNQGPVVTMRGVQTPPANHNADQSVSFVFDNIPVSTSTVARHGQIDMHQMEVLKGPQALFFGKNTTAGLLNFLSNDPGDEVEFIAKTGFESEADEFYVQGIVSGPLSETLKGRLVLRTSDRKGWLDKSAPPNTLYDNPGEIDFANGVLIRPFVGHAPGSTYDRGPVSDYNFVRGTLLWDPSDRLSMRAKLSYVDQEHDGNVGNTQFGFCDGGSAAPLLATANLLNFADASKLHIFSPNDDCKVDGRAPHHAPSQAAAEAMIGPGAKGENAGTSKTLLGSLVFNYDILDSLTLTSVTGLFQAEDEYSGSFVGGVGSGFHAAYVPSENENISQEFRITSNYDSGFNFMAGVFYEDAEFENSLTVWFPLFGLVTAFRPVRHVDTESWSAFAQFDWDLSEDVNLSVGGRYTEEDKVFTTVIDGVEAPALPNSERTFDNFSPEVTLTWQPEDHLNFFASYKEGFKPGGYNVTFVVFLSNLINRPLDLSYDQEEADGFEIGAKTQWLDDRLLLNAAYYNYTFIDLQSVIHDPRVASLSILNAGKLVTQGIELDVMYLPPFVEGLAFTSSLSWNDAEYDGQFWFDCYSGQTVAQGCFNRAQELGSASPVFQQDLGGAPPANAPEVQATLGLSYEFALSSSVMMELHASSAYSDEFFNSQEHDPRSIQDSYWIHNAGLSVRSSDDRWSLSLAGRNLTNKHVCTVTFKASQSLARPAVDMYCSTERARQVWFEAEYRF